MKKDEQINLFIKSVLVVADKFIKKVDTGKARSIVTYADLQKLKREALALQEKEGA